MNIGIDPGGRAFRWLAGQDLVKTAYAVLGCPAYKSPAGVKDQDELITWGDPKAFRHQVPESSTLPTSLIAVEDLWLDLAKGNEIWQNGQLIADAIKAHCPDGSHSLQRIAFAIPNRLNEDAQDALLRALGQTYRDVLLLWRPVAIMFHWLIHAGGKDTLKTADPKTAIWVLDLDSAGIEFTRLGWRQHPTDTSWIAPVRVFATRCLPPHDNLLKTAWREIFGAFAECDQLRRCQTACEVQQALESDAKTFEVWHYNNFRWRKTCVTKPPSLTHTWDVLHHELPFSSNQIPQVGDVVLAHGWLTCFDPQGVKAMLHARYPGVTIIVQPADAIARGAQIYAERRAAMQPTYFDTLPEYKIWTSQGEKQLVAPNQEVEPGHPWHLTDDQIRKAFCVNRHRDVFSMLVRRLPCDDPQTEYARRLRLGLVTLLPKELPLQLDATVESAKGNARFTISTADGTASFVSEGKQGARTVTLTYSLDPDNRALGKDTQREPEHKGYLEAQPVIGRIYDNPKNVEMLRLMVYCSKGKGKFEKRKALGDAVRVFRNTDERWETLPAVTLSALERWGWAGHINPHNEPTRGLFGTRSLPDHEISELTHNLTTILWNGGIIPVALGARNEWSKLNNYCHGHASQAYKDHIRGLLNKTAPFPSWAEAHGPGYVLGEDPKDLSLLMNYCINSGFGDSKQARFFWWSFFRMLCWHKEIEINPDVVLDFLKALVKYLPGADLTDNAQKPEKYALFAILFALRVRERHADFLLTAAHKPLQQQLLEIIENGRLSSVAFPPTMVAHMAGVEGDFSSYVARFIRKRDTVPDRELGSSIGTSE